MGSPVLSSVSSLEDLQGIPVNPFLDMAEIHNIRLNPPPTKKWVKFADWDEEALEYSSPVGRRHSSHDVSVLSSSISSETSLGSAGEGGKSMSQLSNFSASLDEPSPPTMFNASFGGYMQNGDAATLRTMFQPPSRKSSSLATPPPTNSSAESVRSDTSVGSPPIHIKFSSFNEFKSFHTNFAELNVDGVEGRSWGSPDNPSRRDQCSRISHSDCSWCGECEAGAKYSAFDDVRQEGGVYLGWSNDVLGTTFGWSEGIKVNIELLSLSVSIFESTEKNVSVCIPEPSFEPHKKLRVFCLFISRKINKEISIEFVAIFP